MKKVVLTEDAPAAIGPYSQAVEVTGGHLLFLSGQIALDPRSMELTGTDAAEQCRRVMENLRQVLKAAGGDLSNLVKTTIYLTDLEDFAAVNDVYASYFDTDPPARATVEVSRLPKGARVEIEGIAVL
jgi:2-iminobutanoate/2-iminopropanoate deaminase